MWVRKVIIFEMYRKRFYSFPKLSPFSAVFVTLSVLLTVTNLYFVILFCSSSLLWNKQQSSTWYVQTDGQNFPPLFSQNSSAEEKECAEGKAKLLKTNWMLKIIASASTFVRNYRKRNLELLEAGKDPEAENDIFSNLSPIVSALNNPNGEKLDVMSLLPKLISSYLQIKRSGALDGGNMDNVGQRFHRQTGNSENSPLTDLQFLQNLLPKR